MFRVILLFTLLSPLAGIIAGDITRLIKNKMILFYINKKYIYLSLFAVFFTPYFRAWLNSGGISTILHISLFVDLFLTFLFLRSIEKLSATKL